jgi:hypothetical protein
MARESSRSSKERRLITLLSSCRLLIVDGADSAFRSPHIRVLSHNTPHFELETKAFTPPRVSLRRA